MGRHENYNHIPAGGYNINDNSRKVQIVHRTIGGAPGGFAGKIFGGMISPISVVWPGEKVPDLDHHWAIRVGDWYHQLQATSLFGGDNYYDNQKYDGWKGAWDEYTVGETNFNDVAIASAGIQTINEMPEIYNAVDNNCQKFVIKLLDKICRNGRKKVRTLYSPLTPQIGFVPGAERDDVTLGEEVEVAYVENGAAHLAQLEKVADIMAENTPSIDQEEYEKRAKAAETQTEE
ncbi:hypothetical protein QBC43DRAFT_374199 [Cladorrhinum sp. PSN259]|nr:hypothetical protein QBC43DRAFT_374199 [Cladorrhinum sp. PSN259]